MELEQGYLICHNPWRVINSFFSAYHILATYEFNPLHNGKICFFAKNSTFLTNADVWCLLKPDVVIPSTKSGIFLEQANVVFFFQPHECLCHVQSWYTPTNHDDITGHLFHVGLLKWKKNQMIHSQSGDKWTPLSLNSTLPLWPFNDKENYENFTFIVLSLSFGC